MLSSLKDIKEFFSVPPTLVPHTFELNKLWDTWGQLNFTQDKEVVKIGGLSASVKEEKSVPQWIGGVGVLVGLGLIVAGAMRK